MFGLDDTNDTSDTNDREDDIPENFRPRSDRDAGIVLAKTVLEAAFTKKMQALVKRHPSVIVLAVPNAEWIPLMSRAIKTMADAPAVRGVAERYRSSKGSQRVGKDELQWLQTGRSVLYISQNPSDLLDEDVLAGVDVTVVIPVLNASLLRRAIRTMTGAIVRGVTPSMADLDVGLISTLLRPGMSAKQCVRNLRRAVQIGNDAPEPQTYAAPMLGDLPLTANVRTWADQVLADLSAVRSGELGADRLIPAVLEGPPGTGKTLIAECLAQSSGWAFVPTSVGSWFATGDGALGGVSRNARKFFETLVSRAPSIGFLDELDAIPNRASIDNRGRDWWTPVITLILTEIDTMRKSGKPILLLGATNYYDRLDDALVRPGRLQERISVLPPESEEEVIAVLRHYLGDDLARIDLSRIARLGQGATPARIEGWVKAARGLARAEKRSLLIGDILAQVVPLDTRTAADIRTVAIHEIGHAITAHRLGLVVESVSIIPAGASSGHTVARKTTLMPTSDQVMDYVTLALGGRAADMVVGQGANSGAESDLAEATQLLLSAYETQGLYERLASRHVLGAIAAPPDLRRDIGTKLREGLDRAVDIVRQDRDLILILAEQLIREKMFSAQQWLDALAEADLGSAGTNPAAMGTVQVEPPQLPRASRARGGADRFHLEASGHVLLRRRVDQNLKAGGVDGSLA